MTLGDTASVAMSKLGRKRETQESKAAKPQSRKPRLRVKSSLRVAPRLSSVSVYQEQNIGAQDTFRCFRHVGLA
jgi:hypothetical protein